MDVVVGIGASLLISSAPIMIALLSTLLLGERLRWVGWFGTLMSFSGVALITIGEGKAMQFEPSALLVLFTAFGTNWYAVLQKPLLKKYRAIGLVTYSIWVGTFFMLVFLPGFGQALLHAPIEATRAAVYLGICATAIGYVTFSYALAKAPASLVASYIYIIHEIHTIGEGIRIPHRLLLATSISSQCLPFSLQAVDKRGTNVAIAGWGCGSVGRRGTGDDSRVWEGKEWENVNCLYVLMICYTISDNITRQPEPG